MPNWNFLTIIALGAGLAIASLTSVAAKLKPLQGAGVALGVLILMVALLPPGKISVAGSSYEPLVVAKADEIDATSKQIAALSVRLTALENKLVIANSPTASATQKQTADHASSEAKAAYARAAVTADTARARYLNALHGLRPPVSQPSSPCDVNRTEDGRPLLTEDGKMIISEGCGH